MFDLAIKEIMTDHPVRIKHDVSVSDVAHVLLRYKINGIIVVKSDDENELVGIFTTTDLLELVDHAMSSGKEKLEELKRFSELPVGDVASKAVIKLKQDDTILDAIHIMHKKNVHTLPVYDGKDLVGVVGRHDLLNVAFR